ncbi:helix-turn-helix transcriptional regulator [Nocardioides anomalus]|uniref:Helix-turn-helix transcriptional regulator n=1 Tax=Nocardioides anomalus TaxID=2712223 RepID=A0A6G6WIW0_9ACTN|nr:helix-turn-helix transcriptional regulator [Nocardioides anomalus]QIG45268.1 helix-turn-helix transcriptional regulator [Nocardioides anomalus]
MDQVELGAFLRSRRERLTPAALGLPDHARRRTPGLRREEVAQLAHISTEYYTRLEQARAPRPSREVLAALARALRLDDAERDHLHHLAGTPPGPPSALRRDVRDSVLDLLERLPGAAAVVTSAAFDVLAWNDLAAALMEDFSAVAPRERNLARRAFLPEPDRPVLYGVDDLAAFRARVVRRLRAATGRYPDDPGLRALVADLRAGSAEFEAAWAAREVADEPTLTKTFAHPAVGPVTVRCDVLGVADRDQQLVVHTAAPGSRDEELLRLLAVVGTQRLLTPG